MKTMRLLGAFAFLLFLPAGIATGQCEPEIIAGLGGGEPYDVELVGTTAYVANESGGLLILDMSDPDNPVTLASLVVGDLVWDVAISDSIAYLAARRGIYGALWMVDVSDPRNPTILGSVDDFDDELTSVAIEGTHAVVLKRHRRLEIVDVSDPTAPIIIGPGINVDGRDVAVSGGFAYVGGLTVVDIRNPRNPRIVGENIIDSGRDIETSGSLAYVAGGSSGLLIFDISDPMQPALRGSVATPEDANGVAIDGSIAYVSIADTGMHVIDVSDPTSPVTIGTIDLSGSHHGIDVFASTVCLVSNWSPVMSYMIDVSDPKNPAVRSSMPPDRPHQATALELSGDIAYFAEDKFGLVTVDISDPTKPVLLGEIELGPDISDLAVDGNLAYVAANNDGLIIVDVSDPARLHVIGSINPPGGRVATVAVSGSFAYLKCNFKELCIYDVSDPANPILVGSTPTPHQAMDIAISGSIAYLASGFLDVVDISDPRNPQFVTSVNGVIAHHVHISGTTAYVAGGSANEFGRFSILDVSDPTDPIVVGSFQDENETFRGFTVAGSKAWVAWDGEGLAIIDISDPTNPVLESRFDAWSFNSWDVKVADSIAYVAGQWVGLNILDISFCPPLAAEFVSSTIITGFRVGGGVDELRETDDTYFHIRSDFGPTVIDLHNLEWEARAVTTVQSPSTLQLNLEAHIDEPAGTAQVRLWNWKTGEFDVVREYALTDEDVIETIVDINASTYVNTQGEITLRIKHIVFVPFRPFRFESFLDWVRIGVRN